MTDLQPRDYEPVGLFNARPASFSEDMVYRLDPEEWERRQREDWKFITDHVDDRTSHLTSKGMFNASVYIDNDNEYALGALPIAEATSRSMADNYWRGLFTRNLAANQYMARKMVAGRDQAGRLSELTPEKRQFLEANSLQWSNWTRHPMDHIDPLAGTDLGFYDSPQDFLSMETPGHSTDRLLDDLEEHHPAQYSFYMQRFGGREGIKELTKDAKSADRFYYIINSEIETSALQLAMKQYMEERQGFEETWNTTVWPFLRDGLLNDPDMPASLAIAIATFGTGAGLSLGAFVLKSAVTAGKTASRASKLARFIKLVDSVGRTGQRITKVNMFLPERIAQTMVEKFGPKVVSTGLKNATSRSIPFTRRVPGTSGKGVRW